MKKFIHILFIMLCFSSTKAQDIHFSQFNDLPLNINPALSGNMDGTIRSGMNYRNQWNSVSVPFESTGLYSDFKVKPSFLNGKSIGVGVQFLNDRSGSGGLVENILSVSGSYHHYLSKAQDKLITAGLNIGFFQKSFDVSKLNFATQFQYENANFGNLSNLENFESSSLLRGDISLGAAFTYFSPLDYQVTAGLSAFHLNTPNQSFYGDEDPLSPRINFHSNGIIPINKQMDLAPSILMMWQSKASSYVFGANLVYSLGRKVVEKIDLKVGTYLRTGDAMIFLIGMNHDNWSINLSYDLTVSSLSASSNSVGAFELSLSFVNRMYKGAKNMKHIVPPTRLL